MLQKINIIGCGHLGKTIASLIKQAVVGDIQAVCNSTINSAKAAVEFIGQGRACAKIKDFFPVDIYLIGTPDDKIALMCQSLVEQHNPRKGTIVFHCSGSLSSEVLSSAKNSGCYIASMHPVRSFANPLFNIEKFNGTYCAFEGDEQARQVLQPLFEKIGGIVFSINKEQKTIYHTAGIFASNYLVTLSLIAMECYKQAGIVEETALLLANKLMANTLDNLQTLSSHSKALTGPLVRGDINTVLAHMNTLEEKMPEYAELYKVLGKHTLSLLSPMVRMSFQQSPSTIKLFSKNNSD